MPIGCPPPAENKKRKILIQQDFPLIELMTRIELVTSSLPMRCATDCATSACVKRKYDINISLSGMQDHFQEISNSSSRRRMQFPQMESIFPVSKDSLQRYAASETAVPS